MSDVLSVRGQEYIQDSSLMITGWNIWNANKYSDQVCTPGVFVDVWSSMRGLQNPSGCINLGTSELKICYDVLVDGLTTRATKPVPEHMTHYLTHHGDLSFRQVRRTSMHARVC